MTWPLLNKSPVARAITVALSVWLTACASGGLRETPKALPDPLPQEAEVAIEWWHILGDQYADKSIAGLKPTVAESGDRIITALASGELLAIDAQGKVTRLGDLGVSITSPVTLDSNQLILADEQGNVRVVTEDLTPVWTLALNALVTEAPLVTDERVFVQSIDGRISAIERITGRLLWSFQDAEPDLTLTGTSRPVLVSTAQGDALVSGLANGKLVAISVVDGSVIWEYRITRASGKTEVSRLVDVDAQTTLLGSRLIASSYQGDLVVIDAATGRVLQARPFSTYRSILAEDEVWFGVKANSHVVAMDPATLEERWVNDDLEFRQVSELVRLGDVLVMTDREGWLHVLDVHSGDYLGARHIDWQGVQREPVPFSDGVLVQGDSTRLKFIKIR
ncbi:PQQ-binding-like beta-propeller repeat protein [Reinekea blandensis]|uniref:Outer membrane protein assembly factor BamB n=1 Tax=Reinekea blandensis MED297 TaxID=314283 RepID=A4BH43_9GAMM|nr:PQQ-binding-like beta-propeller repeat protein [Reinekea blandensis]EAR08542.1 hypothetical protein MED297_15010 [Reinekea sp. MED297] [Reinekea blandensis MED297]